MFASAVPEYTVAVFVASAAVIALELRWWRTGLFRTASYWLTMAICFGFMIPVNGWLTKLSAPIVIYDDDRRALPRTVLDIPAEDFLFGFALLTLVLLTWVRLGGSNDHEPHPGVRRGRGQRGSTGRPAASGSTDPHVPSER